MVVAIQQPEHLPWLGFFDKMTRCDRFVLLDNVQFKKRYFENRNRIRGPNGVGWVTVPVQSKGQYTQLIRDVKIDNARSWRRKYWTSIVHAYSRTPHFADNAPRFEALLEREWDKLVDLNVALLQLIREILGIETEMPHASAIVGPSTGSELILAICRELGASRYLSGPDGRRYLDLPSFERSGIEVAFHDYRHPEYPQTRSPFVSHLSVIDLIFHQGPRSLAVLRGVA